MALIRCTRPLPARLLAPLSPHADCPRVPCLCSACRLTPYHRNCRSRKFARTRPEIRQSSSTVGWITHSPQCSLVSQLTACTAARDSPRVRPRPCLRAPSAVPEPAAAAPYTLTFALATSLLFDISALISLATVTDPGLLGLHHPSRQSSCP